VVDEVRCACYCNNIHNRHIQRCSKNNIRNMTELPEEIKTVKADHRGRVNLGTDYADKEVRVAILEVDDE